MAANSFDSITERADKAGLSLSVGVSKDLLEQRYLFTRSDGMTKEFSDIASAWHWLDGYIEGVAQATCAERSRSIRADLGC